MDVDDQPLELQLINACSSGDANRVAALLRDGPSALSNYVSDDGTTPLLAACSAGSLEVTQLLLAASAQTDIVDKEGRGVVLSAAEGGSVELLAWLLHQGFGSLADCAEDGSTPLLSAAAGSSVEVVSWLLDGAGLQGDDCMATPSLEERDVRGADALLIAAESGEVSVMRELIRRGSSPASVDENGCGLLHYAAAAGNVDVLKFCVQQLSMNPADAKDCDGDTPLVIAAFEGQLPAVKWLLGNGSTLAERNADGMSVFMAAAAGEHADVINFLSGRGNNGGEAWMDDVDMHGDLVLNFIERGL